MRKWLLQAHLLTVRVSELLASSSYLLPAGTLLLQARLYSEHIDHRVRSLGADIHSHLQSWCPLECTVDDAQHLQDQTCSKP